VLGDLGWVSLALDDVWWLGWVSSLLVTMCAAWVRVSVVIEDASCLC
jgi:hypothetical protein